MSEEDHRDQEARSSIYENMDYWFPFLNGIAVFTASDIDRMTPWELRQVNEAARIRAEIEERKWRTSSDR